MSSLLRKFTTFLLLVGGTTLLAVPSGASLQRATVRAALAPGKITHIFVIELENESYLATWGPKSPATYLNNTLRRQGVLLQNYYAIGHNSLDNYIAQVSGQSPTQDTQADCADKGFTFANVLPGTADPKKKVNPGQVDGQGCVYPSSVKTIANQLDAKYPPNRRTHVAAWRAYEQDMGNTPSRDGGTPDPKGGTDCAHPAIGAKDKAEAATAADQYANRHNPLIWFHSVIDNKAECNANVVPLGTLDVRGQPAPSGHLYQDLLSEATTPRFAFITPNLCNDGHDDPCHGTNSAGGSAGGLVGADKFLQSWVPLLLGSPAYKSGDMMIEIAFDEAEPNPADPPDYTSACCSEVPGPNTHAPGNASLPANDAPGGGLVGALILNAKYVQAGSFDTAGSYNHYSALRSYEDLLGLTTGGTDGQGHLGFASTRYVLPFGKDVFSNQ
ncbi:MAG TPA: hypothetical protein VNG12_25240 [Acidimicrobiales bacterium]|nr:hypothetical protein [Acidimicrobiales bacterium]